MENEKWSFEILNDRVIIFQEREKGKATFAPLSKEQAKKFIASIIEGNPIESPWLL